MTLTVLSLYMAYTLELRLLCNGDCIPSKVKDLFVCRYVQDSIPSAKRFDGYRPCKQQLTPIKELKVSSNAHPFITFSLTI